MPVSLRQRLLTSLCSIAVVSTTLMLILQHRSLSSDFETRAEQRFEDSAAAVERLVDHHLEQLQSRYESIAARPYVRAIVESGNVPTIADIASNLGQKQGTSWLAFVDNEGQVIAGAGDVRFQVLAAAGARLVGFEGKPFGVVSVALRGGELEVGSLVAAEPLPATELASWSAISGAEVLFDRGRGDAPNQRRSIIRDAGNWKLSVHAPRILEADQAAISNSRWNLFVAGGASLIVAFAAGLALSKGLVRPIQELGRAAERIGGGDFMVKLESTRADEIGVVARAFERMATHLSNAIVGVSESADHVERVANRISTLTEAVGAASLDQAQETSGASATIDEICAQVEGVAQSVNSSARVLGDSAHDSSTAARGLVAAGEALNKNVRALCEHTDEVACAMATSAAQVARSSNVLTDNSAASSRALGKVVRGTAEVAEYAKRSNQLSSHVVDIAERGREKVQSTADGMSVIQGETRKVEQSISRLGARIGDISAIVNLIESIADEAKLLALNGSIVAARVGDEGRAFSIVADQMKKLANRVFSETERIVKVICAVESEAGNALSAIGRGAESVSEGVELAGEAGTALDAITEAARENSRHMNDVLAATKLQSQAAEHALEQMEKTHSELEQIGAACDEQASLTDSVSQNSVALGEVTEQVLLATESQAQASVRIVDIVEAVRREVEQNGRSLLGQAAAFVEARERLDCVNERAGANRQSIDEVESAVAELLEQGQRLRGEILKMRC